MRFIRKLLWFMLDAFISMMLLTLAIAFALDPRSGWGVVAVLLGLWSWLRVNRARYGNHRLLVGVALVLIATITMGRSVFLPEPRYRVDTPNQVRFGDHGDGYLTGLSYTFSDLKLTQGLVFHRVEDEPIKIEVTLAENVVVLDGEWLITGGEVQASVGMNKTIFLPVTQATWDANQLDQQTEAVAPSVTFELPVTDDQVHHEVELHILAELAFPSPKTQAIVTQTLERKLTLYVGSSTEFMDRLRANRHQAVQNFMKGGGDVGAWLVGIVGLALTVWGGIVVQNHMFAPHSPATLARSQMRLKTMKQAHIRVYDLPPSEGAYVESLEAYSAFDRAGIQPQDVIIRIGSKLTQTPQEVYQALRSVNDLSNVPINVWRKGEVLTLLLEFQRDRADHTKQKTTS